MIPSKQQWKRWSLPSKLTAIGTLVGILGFSTYLIETGYNIYQNLRYSEEVIENVSLVVKISNERINEITLSRRGEVFYWYPGGVKHEIYTFEVIHTEGKKLNNSNLVIPAKSSINATVKLLPSSVARKYLDQGHMDISLSFKGDGFAKSSRIQAFTNENINSFYVPIKIEEKS